MIKKSKSLVLLFVVMMLSFVLVSCNKDDGKRVQAVIDQAEKMDRNELYAKAIEELHGKELVAVGNSSRGKTAQEYFIAYLQGKKFDGTNYVANEGVRKEFPGFKEDLNAKINWTQPKENGIFSQIEADVKSSKPEISMTLIQDGNQIQSKMLDTKYLLNYIPKEWKGNKEANGKPFALQSLNKVFMYNKLNNENKFTNMWDFVAEGEKPMFMGLDSEPVGKNALYMMTQKQYADVIKEAFDALSAADKAYFEPKVNALAAKATELGLTHESAKYALAWIEAWTKQFNQKTDDGPIMNELANNSAAGQSALIVYSKLRSVNETDNVSKSNVVVAAYQDDYVGLGGFMYKHYLQVLKTSPLPWTSVAFIHFMTTTVDGFAPWGKDLGGYPSDPAAGQDHSQDGWEDGVNKFPVLNDRGYDWWTANSKGKGRLVIEDPVYASSVSYKVGDWLDSLR